MEKFTWNPGVLNREPPAENSASAAPTDSERVCRSCGSVMAGCICKDCFDP